MAVADRGGGKEKKVGPGSPQNGVHQLSARPQAVALSYDAARARAPRVTAQGGGDVAERIMELARQHNVPIKEDPLLVQLLSKLELGQMISPELYHVVAEVFAWLYRLDQDQPAEG